MKAIAPLSTVTMRGVTLATVDARLPELVWVSPSDLFVESEYQRDLSEKSVAMVRRIVANWRWAHIKPVICAKVDGKLMALDGQHTAIAAATLGVKSIPAMVVKVATVRERAEAFIGQNCDRLNLTAAHVYFASLAAGDEIAVGVSEACKKAGVKILRHPKGPVPYKIGETLTVGLIHRLVKQHGVNFAARVLKVLVDAKRAPLQASEIAAVSMLLREQPYVGKVDAGNLVTAFRSATPREWEAKAAGRMAKGAKRRVALAEVLFAHVTRRMAA